MSYMDKLFVNYYLYFLALVANSIMIAAVLSRTAERKLDGRLEYMYVSLIGVYARRVRFFEYIFTRFIHGCQDPTTGLEFLIYMSLGWSWVFVDYS